MRTIHGALGRSRTNREEEGGQQWPSTFLPRGRNGADMTTPEAEDAEAECVEQLVAALADERTAAMILPRGTAVCITAVRAQVYDETPPYVTTRATSVQLRDGSTFTIADLIRLKMVVGMGWMGPR